MYRCQLSASSIAHFLSHCISNCVPLILQCLKMKLKFIFKSIIAHSVARVNTCLQENFLYALLSPEYLLHNFAIRRKRRALMWEITQLRLFRKRLSDKIINFPERLFLKNRNIQLTNASVYVKILIRRLK